MLPASEGGAEEGRLLARGQRLVLLQTEAEVAVAEKKREEGTSVFFCGHVVVGGLEFFWSVMCRIMICIHFYKHTHRRRPPSDRGAGPPAGADRAGAGVDRGEQRRGV